MTRAFGVLEFQLVLLRRMADFQPVLVERARTGLGVSVGEMRQVNATWQRFVRAKGAPRGVARLVAVLGPQLSVRDRRTGDLTCRLHHWALPLWPELRFEAVAGPDGGIWQEWLVRAPGEQPPPAPGSGELMPWEYVVSDLERLFPEVRHLPEDAPSRWTSRYAAPDGSGGLLRHQARFVHGLLQETTTLP